MKYVLCIMIFQKIFTQTCFFWTHIILAFLNELHNIWNIMTFLRAQGSLINKNLHISTTCLVWPFSDVPFYLGQPLHKDYMSYLIFFRSSLLKPSLKPPIFYDLSLRFLLILKSLCIKTICLIWPFSEVPFDLEKLSHEDHLPYMTFFRSSLWSWKTITLRPLVLYDLFRISLWSWKTFAYRPCLIWPFSEVPFDLEKPSH